jgi:hypothetical protein
MSQINELLTKEPVQRAVWANFGIDSNCPLPNFDSDLLYGSVSEIIHKPEIEDLVISNMSDQRCFYEALAKIQKRKIREFNEYEAAAYELNSV